MTHDHAELVAPGRLEITRYLPASPERVWQYLTDPELRQQWFCGGETGNQSGAPFVMDFDHTRISQSAPPPEIGCMDPVVVPGTLMTFDPPRTLTYRWPGETEEDASIVTIELTATDTGTRLHLTHHQLTTPEFRIGAAAGWHAHLDLLADRVQGLPARDFWIHYAAVKAEYDQRYAEATH